MSLILHLQAILQVITKSENVILQFATFGLFITIFDRCIITKCGKRYLTHQEDI